MTGREEELKKDYERWSRLFCQGGQDPFWTDGNNLQIVRNHIIYDKTRLEKEGDTAVMPKEYSWPLPPEIPSGYMARGKDLWYHGLECYKQYVADENYQYLCQVKDALSPGIKKESHIESVVGYVYAVQSALMEKDYLLLRRHEHPEMGLKRFRACRKCVEDLMLKKREENVQMNLFQMGMERSGGISR